MLALSIGSRSKLRVSTYRCILYRRYVCCIHECEQLITFQRLPDILTRIANEMATEVDSKVCDYSRLSPGDGQEAETSRRESPPIHRPRCSLQANVFAYDDPLLGGGCGEESQRQAQQVEQYCESTKLYSHRGHTYRRNGVSHCEFPSHVMCAYLQLSVIMQSPFVFFVSSRSCSLILCSSFPVVRSHPHITLFLPLTSPSHAI